MSDLVERLRERRLTVMPSPEYFGGSLPDPLCIEAAEEIERLEMALENEKEYARYAEKYGRDRS